MAVDWPTMTLREANVTLIDCDHRTPPAADSGYPYVAIPQLRAGRIDLTNARRITREHYVEWTQKAKPSANDVILSRRCNPGETAVTPPDLELALGQNLVLLRADSTKVYPPFLRWLVRGPEWWEQIRKFINVGAVFDSLKCADVPNFELRIPPLSEQRAIAHMLGTLDDKIELNRRMNKTLEAMARAVFKSWFVDFLPVREKAAARTQTGGPVRAKAEGRDPGLPKLLTDFFPDSFEDSELGEIPKGWEVGPLDSVLVLQRGFDLPATQRTSGAYPVLAASGPSGTHNEFMVRGPSVTTGRSGVLGKVFYVDDDFWPLNTSLWVKEFRRSRPAYAFHLLLGIDFALFNAGSAVPTLNRNHVHNLPTLRPPMGLIDVFERVATENLDRQKHNDGQSRTLAALRDTLLPKLLSGEIRLPQMEQEATVVVHDSVRPLSKPTKRATDEFVEAVLIAQLVRKVSERQHPLGRKRYNKLAYLAHRKTDDDVTEHYLKKAAGPYSPWAQYRGPERIAREKRYVKHIKTTKYEGLVTGKNVKEINRYISRYPVCTAVDWVLGAKFQFRTNDDLELLTTVDFAALDFLRDGKGISLEAIKRVIATNKQWVPKLKRAIFSDENITRALDELRKLFPATYSRDGDAV